MIPSLGIITGLAQEAETIGPGPAIACAGADAGRALAACDALLAAGATAILSFGFAAGLDPALPPGTVIIAAGVIAPDGRRFDADAAWSARLRRRIEFAEVADIAASGHLLADAEAKQALRKTTGAAIADMESHPAALAASAAGLIFQAIRIVLDPAEQGLPMAARYAVAMDGTVRLTPVMMALARRPWEMAAMVRLTRHHARALAALRRVTQAAGPDFAL